LPVYDLDLDIARDSWLLCYRTGDLFSKVSSLLHKYTSRNGIIPE